MSEKRAKTKVKLIKYRIFKKRKSKSKKKKIKVATTNPLSMMDLGKMGKKIRE
jgi:hypothetical protein